VEDTEITRNAFLAGCGDRAAADAFVPGTQRRLHRLLTYLASADAAEDLVQETYLRAYAALPRYAGRSPARMWLPAIAKHVATDHLRARGRHPRTTHPGDWVDAAERSGRARRTTAGSSRCVTW
jgi:RNA polymerase sigma-70 factor (ECF subfamily)